MKYFGLPEDIISDTQIHQTVLDYVIQFDRIRVEIFYSQSPTNGWPNGVVELATGGISFSLCDSKSEELGEFTRQCTIVLQLA